MYKISLVKWVNLTLRGVFAIIAIIFSCVWIAVSYPVTTVGAIDKSPSCNLSGESTPSSDDTTTAWFQFWDEHIDWQTSGKSWYYPHVTRGQVVGSYELVTRIVKGSSAYTWLLTYFDTLGIHRDLALGHFSVNTYYRPNLASAGTERLVPGWNSNNDANNNWVRDWESDWDWNNSGTTNFTVQRTSAPYYIEDAGGGQSGVSWTLNKWRNDYVKLGWSGNADTVSYRIDSSTTNRLYLPSQPPAHTYLWFIVDDVNAVNHNAVAMADSQARHSVYFSDWSMLMINTANAHARTWVARWKKSICDNINNNPNYKAGWTSLDADDIQRADPAWTAGGDIYLTGGNSLEGHDIQINYKNWTRSMLQELQDAISPNFVMSSPWSVSEWWDSVCCFDASRAFSLEAWYWGDETASEFNAKLNAVKRWRISPCNIHLMTIYAWTNTIGGSQDRHKMVVYAQYQISRETNNDSTYFLYDTNPDYGIKLGDTTNWWFGLMGVDIGEPSDSAVPVSENGVTVWKRPYTKGYIVYKPRPGSGSNYTDVTTHTLPKYYYRLDVNGNIIGDSVNQVSLRNAEGVVMLSTGEETQTSLKPPQPLSPPDGATVDTTQPTLVVKNTQDSLGRPLLYYFELDSTDQFDSQAKKESNPLELDVGEDTTTMWTVPAELSSGVYYWRSKAYVATDSSDKSPFSQVYHFQLSTGIGDSLYDLYLLSPVANELAITLRPTLNAQFIHNHFDLERIRVKFEVSENSTFNSDRTIISPYVNIPEDLTISWTLDQDLKEGRRYFWRVAVYDLDLLVGTSDAGSFFTGSIHVFPNPFVPSKGDNYITFRNIPLNSKIIITTLSGELVRELSDNTSTDVVWDVKNQKGEDLASGSYFYRVDFPSGSASGKIAIIK